MSLDPALPPLLDSAGRDRESPPPRAVLGRSAWLDACLGAERCIFDCSSHHKMHWENGLLGIAFVDDELSLESKHQHL